MKDLLIAISAVTFAVAAPWVVAMGLETVAPGLGAMSLPVTLIAAPWLAFSL